MGEQSTRENLRLLRDTIATLPAEQFDMTEWQAEGYDETAHACGTCACIGGWAERLFFEGRNTGEPQIAVALGIGLDQAFRLFYPDLQLPLEHDRITQSQAVAVLDRLIATGVVDWTAALDMAEA